MYIVLTKEQAEAVAGEYKNNSILAPFPFGDSFLLDEKTLDNYIYEDAFALLDGLERVEIDMSFLSFTDIDELKQWIIDGDYVDFVDMNADIEELKLEMAAHYPRNRL